MREPYVKHFCIERYQALYELRAKSKNLVRIIFTLTDDGTSCFSRRLSSVISGHHAGAGPLPGLFDAHQRWIMLYARAVHKILSQRRYHSMTKHKFIWAGLAIGVPALVLALWKGWWCKV